ncbi:MAG: hypothetical protein KDJ36_17205 [Hyphomicrobiaceae bacterium]|nr:hypothetical protein [Hyphomicrobiaceae bacterium]
MGLLTLLLLFIFGTVQSWAAPAAVEQPEATSAVYLPIVNGVQANQATSTPTATPTVAVPTATPTVMPTPTIQPSNRLPDELAATWYSGNAPLNDFYNPQTGEWRDVNGLGQMYVFSDDGSYTYTGFLRLQIGACRSEVSTFKQGTAVADNSALRLTPILVKTRSITICGSREESFTDGPYDQIIQPWIVDEGEDGHEVLTVGTAAEATTYYKAGMVKSLVGVWHSGALTPTGFYEPTTNQFELESAEGMWFDFMGNSTYRFGEHSHSQADAEGCFMEWWVYQEGTIDVVGGRITVTPAQGTRRLLNSCQPDQPNQEPWLDDARDYTWFYRDRSTAVKLVIIPLSVFVEFIFVPL